MDLVNFCCLFATVMLVYASLAYILVGSYVDELSTLGDCIHLFSLIAVGEFSDLATPYQLSSLDPLTKLRCASVHFSEYFRHPLYRGGASC